FTNYPHIGPDTADFLDWMAKQGFNQFMVNLAVRGAWETCRDHLLPAARLRGIETTVGHHSFHFWVPPAEFFDVHPDYFALIDGQRRPDAQLCTSNPEVRRLVAERIVEFLRANPEIREVGLWPRDGFGWCQCPDCAAEEPQEPSWWDPAQPRRTDTYLGFVNAVAEAVSEEIPGARISALAYLNYVEPPRDVRPADNVIIYFAPFMRCFKHPLGATECQRRNPKYSELILQWREVAQELRLFAYLMQIDTFSLPYRLTNMLEPNLDFLEQVGVDGWVMEYDVRDWATFSANAYVIAKLSWKTAAQPETLSPAPSRKGEALLRDFLYPALYGPAADDMAEYFSHIAELMVESGPCTGHYDLTWAMRATPEYLRPALAALGRASAAAARDRKAWSAVRRAAASVEFLLRVGRWQRALADLREASEYTRKRKMELACWAADQVVEWAEGHSDLGIINAPKIVSRLRREMERWLQAAP
ncbi:MAG: DUF4838 domain-containing protein, partial [Armatimonadetes bacterium]|nr:DUF4838 domain-containing protein [Armatimonadota bacterium]